MPEENMGESAPASLVEAMYTAPSPAPEAYAPTEAASSALTAAPAPAPNVSEQQTPATATPNAEAATEVPEGSLYDFLQSFEDEPKDDPVASLEQVLAQNPQAAETFKAYASQQAEIAQQFEAIQEKAAAIGGPEVIPQALDIVSGLVNGMTAGADGAIPLDRALDTLAKVNPAIPYQLTGRLLMRGLEEEGVSDMIVAQVLKKSGLSPELLQAYRNVTIDGGYKPAIASEQKTAIVEAVNKLRGEREMNFDYLSAFNRLPEKLQMDLLEKGDDPEYCKFILNGAAKDILAEQQYAETAKIQAEQQQQKIEFEGAKESNTMMQDALQEHFQTLVARGVPENVVKSVMFDTVMELWKGYFNPESQYQQLEGKILNAYRGGDMTTVKNGKKEYFNYIQGVLQTNLRKISTASVQGLPPRTKKSGAPSVGQNGAFNPDPSPTSTANASSLVDAMGR